MKKGLAVLLLLCTIGGCTKTEKSTRILTSQGYTDIVITGYNVFGCSRDDTYQTGFTARGVNGEKVKGTVCEGLLFKGATVRLD